MSRPPESKPGSFAIGNHGHQLSPDSGQSAVSLAGFARRNHPDRPYAVVNDFVASQLGLLMGVPVPPTALVNLGDSTGVVSLMFGDRGLRPPPADLARLAHDDPRSAAGIYTLDQWVLNGDRHNENVAYFPGAGVSAFDFDSALIGLKPPQSVRANLHLGVDRPVVAHPLAAHMLDVSHLASWQHRASVITQRDIETIVFKCLDAGLLDHRPYGPPDRLHSVCELILCGSVDCRGLAERRLPFMPADLS